MIWLKRDGVPLRCQHKAHWWPHLRMCFRRYMLYGTCRKHGRDCYFGHTKEQREAAHAEIIRAVAASEVGYRKLRRRDDPGEGSQGPDTPPVR